MFADEFIFAVAKHNMVTLLQILTDKNIVGCSKRWRAKTLADGWQNSYDTIILEL